MLKVAGQGTKQLHVHTCLMSSGMLQTCTKSCGEILSPVSPTCSAAAVYCHPDCEGRLV